jgi:hypothetical protein
MISPASPMRISIVDRSMTLHERLRERLDRAAVLRCEVHDQPVVAVTLHNRENGWFDSQWTTCCENLERQAMAIVKERC